MSAIRCSAALVDETLDELRAGGREGIERVVLWLSPRPLSTAPIIVEAYVPEQEADVDYFHIPPSGMTALMTHLRERRLVLAAQVHSHPARAFHSLADDKWAIVLHEGALSIVVPNFAAAIDAGGFLSAAAVFRLTSDDKWREVKREDIGGAIQLT
jgi:proteasome lid subunit RPN8/RPN11